MFKRFAFVLIAFAMVAFAAPAFAQVNNATLELRAGAVVGDYATHVPIRYYPERFSGGHPNYPLARATATNFFAGGRAMAYLGVGRLRPTAALTFDYVKRNTFLLSPSLGLDYTPRESSRIDFNVHGGVVAVLHRNYSPHLLGAYGAGPRFFLFREKYAFIGLDYTHFASGKNQATASLGWRF